MQDGRITPEELMRVNLLNAWARRDMDTNKDGLLSRHLKHSLTSLTQPRQLESRHVTQTASSAGTLVTRHAPMHHQQPPAPPALSPDTYPCRPEPCLIPLISSTSADMLHVG
jgi:hypothetical protein